MPGVTPPRNRSPIETPAITPYTTSGTLGGMMMPVSPAAAMIAAEKGRSYPRFSISGKRMVPMAAVVAADDPEMAEKNTPVSLATMPRPPIIQPNMESAKATSRFETPP